MEQYQLNTAHLPHSPPESIKESLTVKNTDSLKRKNHHGLFVVVLNSKKLILF